MQRREGGVGIRPARTGAPTGKRPAVDEDARDCGGGAAGGGCKQGLELQSSSSSFFSAGTKLGTELGRGRRAVVRQEKYYNKPTRGMSRESVMGHIINLAVEAVGNSSIAAFEKGFEDSKTDRAARTSFNYGCSRGVIGTPFFFVNGFPLPGAGSALNYDQWRAIIDPLLLEHNEDSHKYLSNFHDGF